MISELFNTSANLMLHDAAEIVYLLVTSRLIPFAVMRIMKAKINLEESKFDGNIKLKFAQWGIIITLPICSLILIHFFYDITKDLKGIDNTNVSLVIIGIVIFNIIFYLVYLRVLKAMEIETKEVLK